MKCHIVEGHIRLDLVDSDQYNCKYRYLFICMYCSKYLAIFLGCLLLTNMHTITHI